MEARDYAKCPRGTSVGYSVDYSPPPLLRRLIHVGHVSDSCPCLIHAAKGVQWRKNAGRVLGNSRRWGDAEPHVWGGGGGATGHCNQTTAEGETQNAEQLVITDPRFAIGGI